MTDWSKFNFINYLKKSNDEVFKKLPSKSKITTMCARSTINSDVDIKTICKYLPLNSNDILTVKIDNDNVRSLIKWKPNKKPFCNQITIIVRVYEGETDNLEKEKSLNISLFINGTIQLSGVKDMAETNRALNKLIHCLKQPLKEGQFTTNPEQLTIPHFNIYMINAVYYISVPINRDNLFEILKKNKIKCIYDSVVASCVVVKKQCGDIDTPEGKEVSIFIFEKGSIMIKGAKNMDNIVEAYDFMNKFLFEHIDEITKKIDETKIMDTYKDVLVKNSHKLYELGVTQEEYNKVLKKYNPPVVAETVAEN
jgi:TATA-box binding protein (TBP) (component of TFIID and TFIIIB)